MSLIMKKLSLLFTILIITFALAGCIADESQKLYGSWKYSYDISNLLAEADELSYFDLEEHKADVVMTFNADGTYSFGFGEASLKTALEEIKNELVAESEDYIRKIIAEQGAIYQIFAESVVQEMREETEKEIAETVDGLYSELNVTKQGTFFVEDGRIYWDNDTAEYDLYVFKDNTMIIDKPDGADKDGMYPVTLTKIE